MNQLVINSVPDSPEVAGPWAIWSDRLVGALSAFSRNARQADTTPQRSQRIAVIGINGVMSRGGNFNDGTATDHVREQIDALADDDSIDAVLLTINSPGGMYTGTRELGEAVRALSAIKPVHAYISDMGASAAYWIASQASHITAAPDAVVGSIGTFSVVYDASKMAEQSGVTVHVVRAEQSGEMKGVGTFGAPVSETQLAELTKLATVRNQFFLDAVASGRGMNKTQLGLISDGRVFIAAEAAELGLVDEVATYAKALSVLRNATSQDKGTIMTAKAEVIEQDQVSVADSIEEYRAACPSASDGQVIEWLSKSASLTDAMTSHIVALEQRVEQLQAKLAEAETKLTAKKEEKAELAETIDGVEPLANVPTINADVSTSAKTRWNSAIRNLEQQGLSKREAVFQIKQSDPQLWQAFVDESNSK